jgi:hypothetical protein
MAAIKGRQHRTGVADTVFLGVRVRPSNASKADRAADALGISKAALIDALIASLPVDDTGRPLEWAASLPSSARQEVLPLKTA